MLKIKMIFLLLHTDGADNQQLPKQKALKKVENLSLEQVEYLSSLPQLHDTTCDQ